MKAPSRRGAGSKRVPTWCPEATAGMTPSAVPEAITVVTPPPVAMLADATLLAMPPRPPGAAPMSASASSSGRVPAGTSPISSAPVSVAA